VKPSYTPRSWKLLAARLVEIVLGCVFAWSSLAKFLRPYDFLLDVYNYELVGPTTALSVAVILPTLEFIIAMCILGKVLRLGALFLSTLLLVGFTIIQLSAIHRGLGIACGCFGPSSQETLLSYFTVGRTLLLALMSIAAFACLLPGHVGQRGITQVRS